MCVFILFKLVFFVVEFLKSAPRVVTKGANFSILGGAKKLQHIIKGNAISYKRDPWMMSIIQKIDCHTKSKKKKNVTMVYSDVNGVGKEGKLSKSHLI